MHLHKRIVSCRCSHIVLLCVLVAVVAACSSAPANQSPIAVKTPTSIMAGGEPVLPHSQILFHEAPLPAQADFRFGDDAWTLAGHDSDATRAVELPSCCTAAAPVPLWYRSPATPLLYAPIVWNGRVYLLAADGYLHVLDALNGTEEWRVAVGGSLTASGLALGDELIYLALAGHFMAALDANNGHERWRFDTGGVVRGAPLVVGRVLLVASGANTLWCLDALTGEKYWVFHSEDALAEFWPTRTPPVVSGGLVFVALGASNEFNALNLRTGRKVWEAALHERVTGGPVLDESLGLIYVVKWSGRVVALDARSGEVRWEAQLPGGSASSPALSERASILYLGSLAGAVYALDAGTGKIRWQFSAGSPVTASPAVVQDGNTSWIIFATQGGICMVLDGDSGRRLYSWSLGELRAAPVVAGGVLYQASLGDRGLFAFKL